MSPSRCFRDVFKNSCRVAVGRQGKALFKFRPELRKLRKRARYHNMAEAVRDHASFVYAAGQL